MQPTFFPWLGYFDLISKSNFFVFYDDVQFVKQSWQTRNRIKTANGVIFINIPVIKNKLNSKINQIEIDNRKPWGKKIKKTLFYTYQKSLYFEEVYPFFEELLDKQYKKLYEFNSNVIVEICKKIGIETNFYFSSNLSSNKNIKDKRLVDICKELDCNQYLSTIGSSFYIESDSPGGEFIKNQIELFYHNYLPVEYSQNFDKFEPYMSIIDLLFNEGFKKSNIIINQGSEKFIQSKDLKNVQ
jgi:hypothetical protein